MRNLKRVLSLTLASVMLLGMMVIGSSAASDYTDVDYENDNIEAIEVLNAIGVMNGDLDNNGNLAGTFRPGEEVKRSEMARIMAFLMDLDYDYYIGVNPFTDMVGHWAEGYAAACAANGIIAGRTNTTYDPNATVTAVEAAAMLMRALGYFQNWAVDYADGFEIATVRQAGRINLFNKVDAKTNEPMTRNDVAQLVLNALQSGMVEPNNNNKIDVTVGDAQVSIGSSNYVYVVSRDKVVGNAINTDKAENGNGADGLEGPILDLGEKLYNGKLKLEKYDTDAFYRPARTWEYDGEKIGTYVKDELLRAEYTKKVTGSELYDLLTANTVENYASVISIDGVRSKDIMVTATDDHGYFDATDLYRANKDGVGGTGKGVLTQVYIDPTQGAKGTYYISVINTYLAITNEKYDEKNDEIDLKVYKIEKTHSTPVYQKGGTKPTIITVDGEDFDIKDMTKDEIYLVRVAQGEVQEMYIPEVVEKTPIDTFKKGNWVISEGTQYDYASTAKYDEEVLDQYDNTNMKDVTFNIILDLYGYMIGLEQNNQPDQYVFLTGIDNNYSNLSYRNVDANIIHLDGTMETVTVNVKDSKFDLGDNDPSQANTWCTYNVNSNGVYVLAQVPVSGTKSALNDKSTPKVKVAQYAQDVTGKDVVTIDSKHVSLHAYDYTGSSQPVVYGNDDTVYLNLDLANIQVRGDKVYKQIVDDVESVTTGVKNVKITVKHQAGATVDKVPYAAPKAEIYTLYNDKGYVIAAATIGENEGVAANYVYVTSDDVIQEHWEEDAAKATTTGKWEWKRTVASQGEKTDLIYVGDTLKYIGAADNKGAMKQGQWYEVKFDGNGRVRKSTPVFNFDGKQKTFLNDTKNEDPEDGFITVLKDLEKAREKKDVVVLEIKTGITNLHFGENGYKGTLFTTTGDKSNGLSVSPDVKVVLALADKDKKAFKEDVLYFEGTGYSALEEALDKMNAVPNYKSGDVELSAIFNGGAGASVIVINDKTAKAVNGKPSTGGTGSTTGTDLKVVNTTAVNEYKNTLKVRGTFKAPDQLTLTFYGSALSGVASAKISFTLEGAGGGAYAEVKEYPITVSESEALWQGRQVCSCPRRRSHHPHLRSHRL